MSARRIGHFNFSFSKGCHLFGLIHPKCTLGKIWNLKMKISRIWTKEWVWLEKFSSSSVYANQIMSQASKILFQKLESCISRNGKKISCLSEWKKLFQHNCNFLLYNFYSLSFKRKNKLIAITVRHFFKQVCVKFL